MSATQRGGLVAAPRAVAQAAAARVAARVAAYREAVTIVFQRYTAGGSHMNESGYNRWMEWSRAAGGVIGSAPADWSNVDDLSMAHKTFADAKAEALTASAGFGDDRGITLAGFLWMESAPWRNRQGGGRRKKSGRKRTRRKRTQCKRSGRKKYGRKKSGRKKSRTRRR